MFSESEIEEVRQVLGGLPPRDDSSPSSGSAVAEAAASEWTTVLKTKSSESSSKKGSDSSSSIERVRTRGNILNSSSNSAEVLERQRLLREQQAKKLEDQRSAQEKKVAWKAYKKASKKLAPGSSNFKKHAPPKGMLCSLLSPTKYAKSDSESESSGSYRDAVLSVAAVASDETDSTSDLDPDGTTLVTLEPKGKPKEDQDDASTEKQPSDFRQAGS